MDQVSWANSWQKWKYRPWKKVGLIYTTSVTWLYHCSQICFIFSFVDSAHTLWKHCKCLAFTTLVSIRSVCFLFGVSDYYFVHWSMLIFTIYVLYPSTVSKSDVIYFAIYVIGVPQQAPDTTQTPEFTKPIPKPRQIKNYLHQSYFLESSS